MSGRSFWLRFILLVASYAVLHVFGLLFYGLSRPFLNVALTAILMLLTVTLLLLGLIKRADKMIDAVRPGNGLRWRILTCAFVALSVVFAPSCPAIKAGLSPLVRFLFLVLVVLLCWFSYRRTTAFVGLLAALSMICRAPIAAAPIDPNHTDMLPLVLLACRRFLSGASPYMDYLMPWKLPLTYLPVIWLPFIPAEIFGLDPRWLSALFGCLAVIVLFRAFPVLERGPYAGAMKLLFAMFIFLSLDLQFGPTTPESVFWLALSLLVFSLSRDSDLGTAVAMGVCLATRQQAVFLLPLLVIYFFRRLGRREAMVSTALTVAVPLAVCLPFYIESPIRFFSGIYTRFGRFALQKWINDRVWEDALSFAPFFYEHGLQRILTPLVIALQLVLYGIALRCLKELSGLLSFMGLSMLLFLVLSPVIWPYMFTPLSILLAASVLNGLSPPEKGTPETG
ncbi:MAG: hypothetical protein JW941_08860 [Candidatus Coatesbacteria bacterium]|nr:hypothetical protein [Candidatus Coatesbacteria bacterium]